MKNIVWLLGGATLLLSACVDLQLPNSAPSTQLNGGLPDSVLAMAAPYQDLTTVRIDPSSGCYVYRYAGPVETTFLPLRSGDGRPICTRLPETTSVS